MQSIEEGVRGGRRWFVEGGYCSNEVW